MVAGAGEAIPHLLGEYGYSVPWSTGIEDTLLVREGTAADA